MPLLYFAACVAVLRPRSWRVASAVRRSAARIEFTQLPTGALLRLPVHALQEHEQPQADCDHMIASITRSANLQKITMPAMTRTIAARASRCPGPILG